MAEINDLETTDANNTLRWPEGITGAQVNDSARALEGILARWFKDTNGSLTSGGSSNAYTLSPNRTISAYYDGLPFVFEANHNNTGAATLTVGGLSAKDIRLPDDSALAGGEIVSGGKYFVIFDSSTDHFQLVSASFGGTLPISRGGTNAATAPAAFGNLKQAATRTATGVVEEATEAEVYGSTNAKFLDAGHLSSAAAAAGALSDGTTIAVDWSAFVYDQVTVSGNRTLGNPTNEQPGQWRVFEVVGNDGTNRTLSFGSEYEVSPTLDDITSTNSYVVSILCLAAGRFRAYADAGGDPT